MIDSFSVFIAIGQDCCRIYRQTGFTLLSFGPNIVPLQTTYYRLSDIGQVVADFLDIVNQINKYQACLWGTDSFGHTLNVAAAEIHLHPVEIVLVNQGRLRRSDVIFL